VLPIVAEVVDVQALAAGRREVDIERHRVGRRHGGIESVVSQRRAGDSLAVVADELVEVTEPAGDLPRPVQFQEAEPVAEQEPPPEPGLDVEQRDLEFQVVRVHVVTCSLLQRR